MDSSPRVLKIKTKINKWDTIKLKSFYTAKEIKNNMKKQPSEWDKICVNEASDKRLISRIYKQVMQLNTKKKKRKEDLNKTFLQRRHIGSQQTQEKMLNITNY